MMKALKFVPVVVLVAMLAAGCGNSNKENKSNSVITEMEKDQVKADVQEFVYPLPTAFEVTKMLNRMGAAYILSLSNDPENAEKYFSEKSRALNLGIYSADLSYASTYNQKQVGIEYMDASNKLIDELGFSEVIDRTIYEQLESAAENKDTLVELLSNTFYSTYDFLNKNGRESVSVLILAGSWTEALYIATHISEDTFNNPEMIKIVMDQKEPLNKLVELIAEHNSNEDVASVGELLKELQLLYSGLEEGSISVAQVKAISEAVGTVRAQMVEI